MSELVVLNDRKTAEMVCEAMSKEEGAIIMSMYNMWVSQINVNIDDGNMTPAAAEEAAGPAPSVIFTGPMFGEDPR